MPPALTVAVDGRLRMTLVFFGPVTLYWAARYWPPRSTAAPDVVTAPDVEMVTDPVLSPLPATVPNCNARDSVTVWAWEGPAHRAAATAIRARRLKILPVRGQGVGAPRALRRAGLLVWGSTAKRPQRAEGPAHGAGRPQ